MKDDCRHCPNICIDKMTIKPLIKYTDQQFKANSGKKFQNF